MVKGSLKIYIIATLFLEGKCACLTLILSILYTMNKVLNLKCETCILLFKINHTGFCNKVNDD